MLTILSFTFPVFALIGIGYVLTRLKVFSAQEASALSKFVMLVALPALLFHATATKPLKELVDPGFLLVLAVTGITTQAIVWTTLRLLKLGPRRRALGVLAAATPNSAFMSFPIMHMIFPDKAPSILAMCLIAENFLFNPIGLIMMEAACRRDDGRSPLALAGPLAMSVLKRPMIIGLILGALVSISGLPLPTLIERPLDLLSQAASPLALFSIGCTLVSLPLTGNVQLAAGLATSKLLFHPAMAICMVAIFTALNLPAPHGDWATAMILSTASPCFAMLPLFAHGSGQEGAASLTVFLATVAAFFTLTAFIAVLV